ncbi:MAG TPA: peptidyl-prolyl cis-trans isomerase [Verrucomicrobiales bacterium]|nr:peptidyl-prolyl cis-trans isomerase [Verrucomicrobiales bacterium]
MKLEASIALLGFSLLAASLVSCSKPAASASEPVILAKAGDGVITVDDFNREVERRIAKNISIPDKAVLLEEMLERLAAVSRAKKAGLDADAETKRSMENILIAKLRAAELETKLRDVAVSDDELRRAYDADTASHSRPAKVRLALIQIKGDAKMSESKRTELRARMEDALKKAAATPAEGGRGAAAGGFGQVAAEVSDDQVSRYRGGDIGWLDEGNFSYHWPKPVLEAGYALEKGATSGIIESDGSFYAIMKTDRRDGASTSFESAKSAIRRDILAKKRLEIEQAFLKETRALTGAEIRQEALAGVSVPVRPPAPSTASNPPPSLPGMTPPPQTP